MQGVYTLPQLKAVLFPLFDAYGIRRAVLFGSYGKGVAPERSDVDLLVDSGLHGLRFVGFQDAIQCALKKEVDLFDVTHIESGSPIDREIQQTGVPFYGK